MRRQIIILTAALLAVAGTVSGQGIDYTLPKTIAVAQVAYEPEPINPPWLSHMTNFDLIEEVSRYGFRALNLWINGDIFDGMGCVPWVTQWGAEVPCSWSHLQDPGRILSEDMRLFWEHPDLEVLILRPQSAAWTWFSQGCDTGVDFNFDHTVADAPYFEIAQKLYAEFWHRDLTIVLVDWEQDWVLLGRGCHGEGNFPWADHDPWYSTDCIDELGSEACGRLVLEERAAWMASLIEWRQESIERARAEAFEIYGETPLRVFHAAVVSRWPHNTAPHEVDYPSVPSVIAGLEHKPDLIGLSYWGSLGNLVPSLEWVVGATGYPPERMFVEEFGAWPAIQAERFTRGVNAFWDFGINLVSIWNWKQTWCDPRPGEANSLWLQKPCTPGAAEKVEFSGPAPGLSVLMELNGWTRPELPGIEDRKPRRKFPMQTREGATP